MNHGNSGLAHGTSGSSQMTMENTELAVKSRELELINKIASTEFNKSDFSYDLSKRKIETYILNTAHPRDGTKAKFFIETLGYSKSNSKEFYDNLAEAIDKKIPSKVTRTQYGIVCEFREKIKGVNGKYEYANIIASIQKDDGKEKYRILTVYPGKKEKK